LGHNWRIHGIALFWLFCICAGAAFYGYYDSVFAFFGIAAFLKGDPFYGDALAAADAYA
jgi:hypothetical protein